MGKQKGRRGWDHTVSKFGLWCSGDFTGERKVLELQWSSGIDPSCPENKETRLLVPNLDSSRRCHDIDQAPSPFLKRTHACKQCTQKLVGSRIPQPRGEILAHLGIHLGDAGL